jgi:aspartate aminotransferase-like enzyme
LRRLRRDLGRHGGNGHRRPDHRTAKRLEQFPLLRAGHAERAGTRAIDSTASTSYACDLRKWLQIMEAYEKGGYAYHGTLPTDALATLRDAMQETSRFGFERARAAQTELGAAVRRMLARKGIRSVAAEGFEAPGVVVSYTDDEGIHNGSKFVALGLQTAAGVPLQCDEPADFRTFRIGLFGLDKLGNVGRTVSQLESALTRILGD